MESRCKAGVIMASTRSGGGVGLRGDGVQVLGYRGLLMVALLFVTATTFVMEDVHCTITTDAVAPAPTPSTRATFNPYEADALNAVFKMWSKETPQLSTLLNWSPEQHPCDNHTADFEETTGYEFQGAWLGVACTSELQNLSEIPGHYLVSVTALRITGSNSSCGSTLSYQCGFDGIIGEFPSQISNLINLKYLEISHNPKLTGPVPDELFRMPNLATVSLNNNSLSGTLTSNVSKANCTLQILDLSHNNFSGSLQVSSDGTLFCSLLNNLNVEFNQLEGSIDFQDCRGKRGLSLDFSNNRFEGTFSIGPIANVGKLDLSYNNFTSIKFANDIGSTQSNGSGNVNMPSSLYLDISNNNFFGLFPEEIFHMPSLYALDMSMNYFWGSIDFGSSNELTSLAFLYFQKNNLSGQFPIEILTARRLQILDASHNEYNQILQLPVLQIDNSSLLQVFITSNKFRKVQYAMNGRLSSYDLQFSSLLLQSYVR